MIGDQMKEVLRSAFDAGRSAFGNVDDFDAWLNRQDIGGLLSAVVEHLSEGEQRVVKVNVPLQPHVQIVFTDAHMIVTQIHRTLHEGMTAELEEASKHILERRYPGPSWTPSTSSDIAQATPQASNPFALPDVNKCPACGHRAHGSWCANMASDNDCSCTVWTKGRSA